MADNNTRASGSEQILQRIGKADVIPEEALKGIMAVARRNDIEIIDWCQFGQPGIDGVCGQFQVSPDQAGAVVAEFLALPDWKCRLDVFPVGITDPSVININLTGGQLAQ